MNLKKVKVVQDDDGHWYVIPEEMYKEFNEKLNYLIRTNYVVSYKLEEFEDVFNKYMLDGDINSTQLYAII